VVVADQDLAENLKELPSEKNARSRWAQMMTELVILKQLIGLLDIVFCEILRPLGSQFGNRRDLVGTADRPQHNK
jgi:hypothetical protein